MKFLLAPDSFKESLTAPEVCAAMERGIKKALPEAECVHLPLSDGGEGFVRTLVMAAGGSYTMAKARDPLGNEITAEYGWLHEDVAVIELAAASGLHLVPPLLRNPLLTSTYGTGILIADAIAQGAKKIVVGLGGSATNDAGAGMMQALGAQFFTAENQELQPGGVNLKHLHRVDLTNFNEKIKGIEFIAACDVSNPLTGASGATHTYSLQKGATPAMTELLENILLHFSQKIHEATGCDWASHPGAGAAGGTGFALLSCFRAKFESGIEFIINHTGLEKKIMECDVVLTGEGSMDEQTLQGKAPAGVARLCLKHHKPLIALTGNRAKNTGPLHAAGFTAIFCILPSITDKETALKNAATNIELTAEEVMRLLMANN